MSESDRALLRELATQVAAIAALPEQAEKARLWTACNDLRPERAMVYADPQNGWKDLEPAWLHLECQDPVLRGFEHPLRRKLIHHQHIRDDFPILDTYEIPVQVSGSGYDDYGLELGRMDADVDDGAYHIEPAVRSEEDLARLHCRPLRIETEAADRSAALAEDLFGDILTVLRTGRMSWRYGLTRPLIHMRGLDQMMLDMYDNPRLLHQLLGLLQEDLSRELDLFEQAGEVSLNNTADHVTGSGGLSPTADLPGPDFDDSPQARHCICWGESQETVGVGPDLFDEFVLQYQLPLLQRFGLVDYGCCESLDHKFDLIINQVPRLRWLAVTPWADREVAADKIGGDYVYVYKPNPSHICAPQPDWDAAEQEIRQTLTIARGCPVHLAMKDTHTFCGEPERLTRWADMATRVAIEMA